MERVSTSSRRRRDDDEQMELPPGFRFHPTDEELITHYLSQKVLDSCFCARAIGDVDLNKVEPWDLPWRAKMGEREWIFQKSSGGKKIHISGLPRMNGRGDDLKPLNLPPLMDCSARGDRKTTATADESHVACFSDVAEDKKPLDDMVDSFRNPLLSASDDVSPVSLLFPKVSVPNSLFPAQFAPNVQKLQYPDSSLMEDQSVLRFLLENDGVDMNRCFKAEYSPETGVSTDISSAMSNHVMGQRIYEDDDAPITSAGPVDLDCLWNY
ncbi:hypothetical protein U1Q18_038560 [Sarracenia purpurea var. burkii]